MTDFETEAMRARTRRTFAVAVAVVVIAAGALLVVAALLLASARTDDCSTAGPADGVEEC